ncbi:hypothetical protein K458DRAFT_404445 [Lentithecium fluviatile CBS 122367]|uniref:Uncharacterized protein n=1 Tax=Lentithecium fluviatile CBS 122367 TaxID=1168545 RepID=A0A6G1J0X1_9PLEO|nr:hypothetical protein K458DRAFT_404445 [Lentithecium fluviatile CBS 122367]
MCSVPTTLANASELTIGQSFWDYTVTDGCLTAIFIDCGESIIQKFSTQVEEKPARVLQPLLLDYILINQLFDWFHNRQVDEIGTLKIYFEFKSPTTEEKFEEGLEKLTTFLTNLERRHALVRRTIPGFENSKSYQKFILKEIDNTERRTHTQLTLMMHQISIVESPANQRLVQQSRDKSEQSNHLASQSKELGELTAILEQQTSADCAAMVTIAVMTMFFLPATFISSLFSTGFFVFDGAGRLGVSDVVWIYPAVNVPLTITVFAVWLVWNKVKPNNMDEAKKKLNEKLKQIRHDTAEQGNARLTDKQ